MTGEQAPATRFGSPRSRARTPPRPAQLSPAANELLQRHLLAHFGGKPTILARETKMNRVTLRRKTRLLGEPPGDE